MNLSEIFNSVDPSGNRLQLIAEDLFLTLSFDHKTRNIGKVKPHHIDGRLLYIKHEKEEDIFRKTNAWSLVYEVVKKVSYILIYTDTTAYKITSEKALEKGSFLWFKNSGYERKIYVPLSEWWTERKH